MGEVHYMISEAAKRVSVETHVLRYWEDELALTIGRTEMGHRYYTEDDVQLFHCIKELKEQGMQLRELKNLIPDMLHAKAQFRLKREQRLLDENTTPSTEEESGSEIYDTSSSNPEALEISALKQALLENNKILEESLGRAVSHVVITEIDFLLQAQERHEEERFRKLDTLIRQQQTLRRESAKQTPLKHFRRLFEA